MARNKGKNSRSQDSSPKEEIAPVIVITGPTATGKTSLSIHLAKWLEQSYRQRAEIISADSRQVYKGLDMGTGKIKPQEMDCIPHHLLDILDPTERYSVANFTKDATRLIRDIHGRGNIAVICGGTGFYVESLVKGIQYPSPTHVDSENSENKYQNISTDELYALLKQKDLARAKNIDPKNRRRIERALFLIETNGKVAPLKFSSPKDMRFLQIGITAEDSLLRKQIMRRLKTRLDEGMINEVAKLHESGLSWQRLNELGLEYRYISEFLQGKIKNKTDLETILEQKIWQYARRQKTWFKKIKEIHWFVSTNEKIFDEKEIFALVSNWLRV